LLDVTPSSPAIDLLVLPVTDLDVRALATLLVDAVQSGAAVSFLASLSQAEAEAWWRQTLATLHSRAAVLVARDRDGIVGSVQLHPGWAPNQPHRADITKLLVHRRSQRSGAGTRLMLAAEDVARQRGYTLLTLDAKAEGPAERLYRRMGWTAVGTIPRYALDPDGTPHDAVFLYKHI
jgi:ribosomal protein S18 acetylase RimI-like enzyme